MSAEKYSTTHAKTPEEVFTLYHAYESGRIKGSDTKLFPILIMGLLLGCVIGMAIASYFRFR